MTHLRIEQNNGVTEEVSSSVITKLYEIAHAGLDASSYLKGRLHASAGYRTQIEYLNAAYPDLIIDVSDYAIPFEDAAIKSALQSGGIGNNGLVTEQQAFVANIGTIFRNNKDITSFNEFPYFVASNQTAIADMFSNSSISQIDLSRCTSLGQGAFWGTALTSINAPMLSNLSGSVQFERCNQLQTVTSLGYITAIAEKMFNECQNLTSVTLPSSCTTIGSSAFSRDWALTTINLTTVTTIGNNAFKECALSNVDAASLASLTSIGGSAFYDCKSFAVALNLPNLTNIDAQAFCKSGITSIQNLGNITSIKQSTFANCTQLTSAVIPATVTSINDEAFYGCNNLTVTMLSTTPPTLGQSCFDGVVAIKVPVGTASNYHTAWSNYASIISES